MKIREEDLVALKSSGAFDAAWYCDTYPDVRRSGMDAAEHYLWLGQRLGRKPSGHKTGDARVEAHNQIRVEWEGSSPQTDALCLFSHFDVDNRIDDYVVHYLQELANCGFSTVFITTCAQIAQSDIDRIRGVVTKIILKDNVGRDFGAWFTGVVSSWQDGRYKRVLLANDSVYGPLFDLREVFNDMSDRGLDLWGITDSFETSYHLQTYFVVFEEKALPLFSQVWSQYCFESDKSTVIANYEIGLTGMARDAGLKVGALCSYYDVRRQALRLVDEQRGIGKTSRQSQLTHVNSSHFFWRALIQTHQCPFVKIELLRDNPSNIDDVFLWHEVIGDSSSLHADLIKKHLSRVQFREHDPLGSLHEDA